MPSKNEIIQSAIDKLQAAHDRAGWDRTGLNGLTQQWETQRDILESKTATPEQTDTAKRWQEALANRLTGLPALATGIRDAVKAFESGDPFAGSAAVMDISASLATTIGAMAGAAAGPAGALLGALLSVVSIILKAFLPQQKSLADQIETVIRDIQAESQEQIVQVSEEAIQSFVNTVTKVAGKWTLTEIETKLNVTDGPAINGIRGAAEWLKQANNQGLKAWGYVLAAQCHAYNRLMHALAIAITSVDITTVEDKGVLTIDKLTAAFKSNDPIQLEFLQKIVPAARNRGIVWTIGTFESVSFYYPDSGSIYFRDSMKNSWQGLGGEQRVIAVSKTNATKSRANPYFAIFGLEPAVYGESSPDFSYRYRKNKRAYGLFGAWPLSANSGWKEITNLQGCYDICATPGAKDDEVYVYAADGKKIDRYVHSGPHSGAEDAELNHSDDVVFPAPNGRTTMAVCAVSEPQSVSGEDPAILADDQWVVYGGSEDPVGGKWINAYFSSGVTGSFRPGPDDMAGMKVDSKHIWVFTRKTIACATHASVKQFCKGASATVEWASYKIPAEFGGDWQRPTRFYPAGGRTEAAFDGLHDLSPCDDGTLVAVFAGKESGLQSAQRVYQSTPKIDRATGSIVIEGTKSNDEGFSVPTNGWNTMGDDPAHRVFKQPIYCWSVVEGLIEALSKSQ